MDIVPDDLKQQILQTIDEIKNYKLQFNDDTETKLLQALEFAQQLNNAQYIGMIRNILSAFNRVRGQYDKALQYALTASTFAAQAKDLPTQAFIHGNLGLISLAKGNKVKGIEYLDKGIELANQVKKYDFAIEIMFQKFYVNFLDKNIEKALNTSREIQTLAAKESTDEILNYAKLTKALQFTLYPRLYAKFTGQKMLQELIDIPFDFELKVIIIEQLLIILFKELEIYEQKEVMDEIDELINKLSILAEQHKSVNYKVISLLLQAKFTLLNKQPVKSKQILDEAKELVSKIQNNTLLNRINKEIVDFNTTINEWRALIEKNRPLTESIKDADIENYLIEVSRIMRSA